ncbi:hypothetical protein HanRHA438_Chr12g0566861 [Helianthus annuus]|nr:hypothetical protein HanRHA438_Chr12g0566861 [Helianthus annuus]
MHRINQHQARSPETYVKTKSAKKCWRAHRFYKSIGFMARLYVAVPHLTTRVKSTNVTPRVSKVKVKVKIEVKVRKDC